MRAALSMPATPVVAQSATTPTPAQIGAAARVLNARCAIQAGINVDDCWKLYGEEFKEDARAALDAAFKISDAAMKGKP